MPSREHPPTHTTRTRPWRTRLLALVAACGPIVAIACGTPSRPSATEGGGTYAPFAGPCSPEGAVHECHVRLGEAGGALGCFVGQQECRGGSWTACGGTNITLSAVDLSGIHTLATPTSDSGVCTLDPCDPYCSGYNNDDASVYPEGGAPEGYFNQTSIFGGSPGGFAGKSDCGSSSKGCNDTSPGQAYPRKCNGEDHYSFWDSCLADTHCDTSLNGGQGSCVANWDTSATSDPRWDEANSRWLPAVCGGVDLTVSAACEVGGVAGFNICNRGNTAATATSIGLFIDNGNADFGSSTFSSGSCPNEAPSCSPTVPGGSLAPGKCFRVTNANCPAWNGNGNPVAYVNPNAAIAECGGTDTAASATGPGCNNNWADVKNKGDACGAVGSTFAPTSRSFTYVASCIPGYQVRWKSLTYSATVPCDPGACNGSNSGKVEFFGTLSTTALDGGSVSQPEKIIADATTTQTVNCTYGTDAGGQPKCPVDLLTWAESVTPGGSNYVTLDLRVLLTPTPNTAAAPTIDSWQVAYDCIPVE